MIFVVLQGMEEWKDMKLPRWVGQEHLRCLGTKVSCNSSLNNHKASPPLQLKMEFLRKAQVLHTKGI